jgi:solute carrier family 25 S-adenosylmethionine transporter 26
MKQVISRWLLVRDDAAPKLQSRLAIHALAAASGNALSSLVFVPKELIKQQLQYHPEKTVAEIIIQAIKQKGLIRGLYCGYQMTLLRNVPSAILRFALYEEFKHLWLQRRQHNTMFAQSAATTTRRTPQHQSQQQQQQQQQHRKFEPMLFLAGALAGALASGCMTPIDVLKTRLATDTLHWSGGSVSAC